MMRRTRGRSLSRMARRRRCGTSILGRKCELGWDGGIEEGIWWGMGWETYMAEHDWASERVPKVNTVDVM